MDILSFYNEGNCDYDDDAVRITFIIIILIIIIEGSWLDLAWWDC